MSDNNTELNIHGETDRTPAENQQSPEQSATQPVQPSNPEQSGTSAPQPIGQAPINNGQPYTQPTQQPPFEPSGSPYGGAPNGYPYSQGYPYNPPYGQYPPSFGGYPYGAPYGGNPYSPYGYPYGQPQQPYGQYPYQNGYPYGAPYGYPYPYPYPYGYPQGFNYPTPEELQKKAERKAKIKRLGNSIGIPLCLFSIISFIVSVIFSVVLYAVFDRTVADSIATDPNVNYILSTCISLICFTLPFIITSKMIGLKWHETMQFKKTNGTTFISVLMLGLGVCALSNYASSILSSVMMGLTGKGSETTMIEFGTDWKSFVISLLCVGIMPALLEEFAFRGIVLGTMRKYMNDGAAILVSALLFGLLHGNLQQIPFAFGVGIALGYATVYCKSIIPAMVLHGINNSVSVILDFATRNMRDSIAGITTMLYLAVLLLIGICGFIMLTLTDKNAFNLSRDNSQSSKADIKYFMSSAAIIVFLVLSGLSVIVTQFL